MISGDKNEHVILSAARDPLHPDRSNGSSRSSHKALHAASYACLSLFLCSTETLALDCAVRMTVLGKGRTSADSWQLFPAQHIDDAVAADAALQHDCPAGIFFDASNSH